MGRHWKISPDVIRVQPYDAKFAVSAKPHAKYRDIIIYVYEFCSVTFMDTHAAESHAAAAESRWHTLRSLRDDPQSLEVNGDVIRALHELFGYDLASVTPSW